MVLRRRRMKSEIAPSAGTRYRMCERMAAVDDDFFIRTDGGQWAFKLDSKALRTRDTLKFEDMHGKELCQIDGRIARIQDKVEVTGARGERLASVSKTRITPVRDRFTIELAGGLTFEIQGNVFAHEFNISGPCGRIAEVSRRWFRKRDSYGVEVAPGQNDVLILAAVVAIEQMINDGL